MTVEALLTRAVRPERNDVGLSFVVIGRNQSATIERCLDSVFGAAEAKAISGFEVIYVDSKSTDGTVAQVRARYGDSVRSILMTAETNAGIARNVGAVSASGKVLFFIDGDMEVEADFLGVVFDAPDRLIHPVVTGQLPERLYDSTGRFLGDAPDRYRVSKQEFSPELGGVFLIERDVFRSVGGFCPELRVNEDLDLGLRLAQQGISVLRMPKTIAIHHTVEYFDLQRLGRMFADGSLYFPGALCRRHLTNSHYFPVFLSHQRPTAVLVLAVVLAIFIHPGWIALYLAYIAAKNLRRPRITYLQDLVGTAARSICFLLGFVFFFPPNIPASRITFTEAR